jgi:7-cyano-7-deazaguanine synthase
LTKKAVVLLSGGIDSSTTAAIAKAEGYDIYALSFEYGQRHRLELESAKKVAESLGAKKHLIIKFDLREIGGSALTADIEVPKEMHRISPIEAIPVTYVPARNTIFLSFALGWAEVLEVPDIFIGANAVDYSGYPDCRPEYLKAFEEMANLATRVSAEGKIKFKIKAPLLYMTKGEIIRKGAEMGFDYAFTWSCYDPLPDGRPCERCDSCLFRAKGFKEAGIKDPLLLKL